MPNLFFVGTLMQAKDFKRSASGFIHGFRYNARTLHNILENRFYGKPLPHSTISPTPEALAGAVIARINTTSALWQQFGFLADLIEMPNDDGMRADDEELPMQYVVELSGRARVLYGHS